MNNNVLNVLNQLIGLGNSPQQIISNALMQNPSYNMVFNQVKTSGLSMRDYVIQYARQNGIDLQPMINMLNQKGIKL